MHVSKNIGLREIALLSTYRFLGPRNKIRGKDYVNARYSITQRQIQRQFLPILVLLYICIDLFFFLLNPK